MGQSQSNKQNNEYFNLLITTLVQSPSEDYVVQGMQEYKDKVQLQHGIIPDYVSDIALVIFLKVTLHFVRK